MYDERSPMPGLELEMPARLEWMQQPLAWGRVVIYDGDG